MLEITILEVLMMIAVPRKKGGELCALSERVEKEGAV